MMVKECSKCGKIKPITVNPYQRPKLDEKDELCKCDKDSYETLVTQMENKLEWRRESIKEHEGEECPNCGEEYENPKSVYDGKRYYIKCDKCGDRESIADAEPKPWND